MAAESVTNEEARLSVFWGKLENKRQKRKALIQHMTETGIVMEVLLKESCFHTTLNLLAKSFNMSTEATTRFCCFLASLHDIAKLDPRLQCNQSAAKAKEPIVEIWDQIKPPSYCPLETERYLHEQGAAEYLSVKMREVAGSDTSELAANCIGLHHQGRGESAKLFRHKYWKDARDAFFDYYINFWNPEFPAKVKNIDATGYILSGLIILSDWIASGESMHGISENSTREQIYEAARSFIIKAGMGWKPVHAPGSFRECWAHKGFKTISSVQETLSRYVESLPDDTYPELIIIEAEPGSGKTEAASYAALKLADRYGKSGIYFALPTMATANGMYPRIEELLNTLGISETVLLHSQTWKENFGKGESDKGEWATSCRLGLLQPSGVGTVDQIMSGVLSIKYGVLRLLGISTKAVIIDEVHSYDDYMLTLIRRLLQYCKIYAAPVILASATLPTKKKRALIRSYTKKAENYQFSNGYPLITIVEKKGKERNIVELQAKASIFRSYHLTTEKLSADEIADALAKKAGAGGNIAYIANTVKRAQEVYRLFKEKCNIPCMCFHSRFTVARRKEIELECLRLYSKGSPDRPEASVLIATQVIEQSLDLDFDWMISDIAPVDLLIQRLGRLFRHDVTKRPTWAKEPEMVIVTSPDVMHIPVYDEEILRETRKTVQKRKLFRFPEDIRPAVEEVYQSFNGFESMTPDELVKAAQRKAEEESSNVIIPSMLPMPDGNLANLENLKPAIDDDDTCGTRMTDDSVRIALLPTDLMNQYSTEVANRKRPSRDTAVKILDYVVGCTGRDFKRINQKLKERFTEGEGLLFGIMMLDTGENPLADETISVKAEGTEILISDEIGLVVQ